MLPAAFNPPTLAHTALAEAAGREHGLDQVAFVLPQALPHKGFEHASFEQRLKLLRAAVVERPHWAVATAQGGLVYEIVEELQALGGPEVEAVLLCGADAAERFTTWDYGGGPSFAEQLRAFEMAVAARFGRYEPPEPLAHRIRAVSLPEEAQGVSSSEVRERVGQGRPWRHMVPPQVADEIERLGLYR